MPIQLNSNHILCNHFDIDNTIIGTSQHVDQLI